MTNKEFLEWLETKTKEYDKEVKNNTKDHWEYVRCRWAFRFVKEEFLDFINMPKEVRDGKN